jgi:hypothetical protein
MVSSRMYSTALLVSLGFGAVGVAQTLPATPHTPDLLGLYPGMTKQAGRAQLQKHSDDVYVQNISGNSFNLVLPNQNRDIVTVSLTQPPNDPPGVWMIQRSQNFDPGNAMSKETLLEAMREKYGKESLMSDHGGGGQYYYWAYDKSGKLLANADPRYMNCSGSLFINNMTNGPDKTNESNALCYGSFIGVTLNLNMRDAQLLQAYSLELVNMPYAVAAATVTRNANKAVAEKARQDAIDQANKNKPKF